MIVVASRFDAERQEQHYGLPPEREQGLQCARDEAYGPGAFRAEQCGPGHHPGERHLPPLQLCGPGEGQQQSQPQEACPNPQSAAQQVQAQGQEIAQIAKTVAQLVKGFEQLFGGGHAGSGGAGGGAGGDGAAHHAAQTAQTGGDQTAAPATRTAAATDSSQNSASPLASVVKTVLANNNSTDSGSSFNIPTDFGLTGSSNDWGNDSSGSSAKSLPDPSADSSGNV